MNTPATAEAVAPSEKNKHLLDAIKQFRTCIGDGLNDVEFSLFLQMAALPAENGFEFLCFSNRYVTLRVPKQDTDKWYRDKGWVCEDKEKRARQIAEKYGLSLYHPPDAVGNHHVTPNSEAEQHSCHHLEMSHNREIFIVIHPHYLKVRLFQATGAPQHGFSVHRTPHMGPELLKDLSTLYQS